jgi:hypothetical protein
MLCAKSLAVLQGGRRKCQRLFLECAPAADLGGGCISAISISSRQLPQRTQHEDLLGGDSSGHDSRAAGGGAGSRAAGGAGAQLQAGQAAGQLRRL